MNEQIIDLAQEMTESIRLFRRAVSDGSAESFDRFNESQDLQGRLWREVGDSVSDFLAIYGQ